MNEDLDPIETEETELTEPEILEESSNAFVAGAVTATLAVPLIYVGAKKGASWVHGKYLGYKAKKNVVLVLDPATQPEPTDPE